MRIAISADNKKGMDSIVAPHFGRCPHFILVDVDGCEVLAVSEIDNPYYPNHEPGQVPAFIHSQGANVMLTGGMGGRAITFFQQFGIEPVTGAGGTVRRALEAYLGGMLSGAAACAESQAHGHGAVATTTGYEKDDIGRLREEADMLSGQLDEMNRRLGKL